MRQLLRTDGWLVACVFALGLLGFAGFGGCVATSPRAVAYKALAITVTSTDAAMKAFADAVVQGKVPQATQEKVRDLHTRYSKAMQAAIAAARFDTGAATPESVQALAGELLALITEVAK